MLRFWLRKGVSGFRCDTVMTLFEADENADGLYDDEPPSGQCDDDPEASCSLKHTKTQDQDETYGKLKKKKMFLNWFLFICIVLCRYDY